MAISASAWSFSPRCGKSCSEVHPAEVQLIIPLWTSRSRWCKCWGQFFLFLYQFYFACLLSVGLNWDMAFITVVSVQCGPCFRLYLHVEREPWNICRTTLWQWEIVLNSITTSQSLANMGGLELLCWSYLRLISIKCAWYTQPLSMIVVWWYFILFFLGKWSILFCFLKSRDA
jgi:hypothetical protein